MKFITRVLSVLAFCAGASTATGQIAGQDLPDLSALQQVFGAVSRGEQSVEADVDESGLIGSGIHVPETGKRGSMAKAIAGMLADLSKNPDMSAPLETAFVQGLDAVESKLSTYGFQSRDYGVAFAFFFLTTWEIANDAQLPDDVAKQTGETLVRTIRASFEKQDEKQTDEELELQYDAFLTLPVAIGVMIEAFNQQGQKDIANSMREMAGQSFEQMLGISPYDIDITKDGIKGWE